MPSFLRAASVIGAWAHLAIGVAGFAVAASGPAKAAIEAPAAVPCFDPAEFTVRIEQPPFKNPFTEAEVTAVFTASNTPPITVPGFADSEDGSTFRLRFAPSQPGAIYQYELRLRGGGLDERFRGTLRCTPSQRPGPVIASPQHPRHFIYAGSGRPFYHLGYTAYHLLDPSNDDAQIAATIDYCAKHGFNKIRFLLAGYPRDFDRRTSGDVEYGVVAQAMKAPNYGARPGQVNPLPAWAGKPHAYDFTRFNVRHWQRVDDAIRRMRERGIVATCIFTIEKQDLPKEYGRLTEHEHRFYRYAIARLAAFDNVWWDLGNEHNEFRDVAWGNIMGPFVKETDPYDRLTSAHAYAEFPYAKSAWADFIITQQYGDCRAVHDWVLRHHATPKPYVNEEYGYEFNADKPGHGQNADWTRRCHWSIAMAGGYATYGDWIGGVAYFYMGEPGPGKAAPQLTHLRSFFEGLPFQDFAPRDDLIKPGFCLAKPGELYVAYLPEGGPCELDLRGVAGTFEVTWYDVRTGRSADGGRIAGGDWRPLGTPPFSGDAAMRRCAPRAKEVRRQTTVHGLQGRKVNRIVQVTRKSDPPMRNCARPTAGPVAQFLAFMLATVPTCLAAPQAFAAEPPVFPGKTWATKTPSEVGLDAAQLKVFGDFVGGRGCVVRHGCLVYSWGDVSRPADVASACKPVLAHFLFQAIEQGKIASLDDELRRFEPRLDDLNTEFGHKDRKITWRHVANQVSCYGVRELAGTAFDYNDFNYALFFDTLFLKGYGSTYAALDEQVLRPLLAGPLQCEDTPTWMAFGTGNRPGRLAISVRDFCRFGLLYLRQGNWNGQQLISASNAVRAVSSPLPNSIPRTAGQAAGMIPGQRSGGGGMNQCDHLSSYSFMWWLNGLDRDGKRHWPDAPADLYGAFGHGGPRVMVVMPALELVMAWNDAKIRSRDAENTALKLLAEACAIRTNAPAKTGMFFPPPGEAMTNQARRQPAEVGLNEEIISALKSHASKGRWALWRDGFLVHVEGNFNQKQDVASLRKTWHALTVGAAIKQGRIPSYSEKISVWNKELTGLHAEATWWHVITQTAGFDYPYGDYPAFKPGEMWTYSDKNPRVLCNALARVYGKKDFQDHYADVVRAAYFDAIGMTGWAAVPQQDGIRLHLDLEDMGRLGLLVLARGQWNGVEVIPRWFVEQLERKQTDGVRVNYSGPDDGKVNLDPKEFPEVPYGFLTWVNTDGDFYPGADTAWAWGAGAGGTYIL